MIDKKKQVLKLSNFIFDFRYLDPFQWEDVYDATDVG